MEMLSKALILKLSWRREKISIPECEFHKYLK
jgi:hypothetical protein